MLQIFDDVVGCFVHFSKLLQPPNLSVSQIWWWMYIFWISRYSNFWRWWGWRARAVFFYLRQKVRNCSSIFDNWILFGARWEKSKVVVKLRVGGARMWGFFLLQLALSKSERSKLFIMSLVGFDEKNLRRQFSLRKYFFSVGEGERKKAGQGASHRLLPSPFPINAVNFYPTILIVSFCIKKNCVFSWFLENFRRSFFCRFYCWQTRCLVS